MMPGHDIMDVHTPNRYDDERRVLAIGGLTLVVGLVVFVASLALF
jgi:hypothetical protein